MAFSAILTGTTQNITATNGSPTLNVTATTGWIIGATIQGTGIPTGARVGSIVTNTSITMVNSSGVPINFTGTTGTIAVLVSSKYGSTLAVSLSASGDYATPQQIYNAGFGVMQNDASKRQLFFPGGLTIEWKNIVSGSVFDFLNWDLEFGNGGRWRFEESSIVGELRGGYLVNGTQFIKTVGPTFYCFNWNNGGAGGSSMFNNVSGTTNQGLFRMHNMRVVEISGSNASPTFYSARMTMDVENLVLDYQADSAGANAGIGAAFGILKNTYLVKTNAGIGQTNGTNYATFDGIYYVGNYQSSPQHKFSLPQGYTLDGYTPQVLSNQFLGGFNAATLETYSNINLNSAGWGLNDLKTKYQRYGGPITLQFPRTVEFQFFDSSAVAMTGVTLYIKSGSTNVINQILSGNYSQYTQALNLIWNTSLNSYRVCTSFVDTIEQVAQVRKFGFIQQKTSYSLNYSKYSQPFFILSDNSLSGITETIASNIVTAGINWSTKTITPTANLTYDQINARLAYELAQITGSAFDDPRTIIGTSLSLANGWTLIVNNNITISVGTNIKYLYVPTITINGIGLITALYGNSVGNSSIWEFQEIEADSSICIFDANGNTKYFNAVNANGTYRYYIAPQAIGETYYYAIEKFGYKRESGSFPSNSGQIMFYVPDYIEDVGITDSKNNIIAYTTVDNIDELYDRLAILRLTENGIKLGDIITRNGIQASISGYDLEVNKSISVPLEIISSKIFVKTTELKNGITYNGGLATDSLHFIQPDTDEIIIASIEDGAGNSSFVIEGGTTGNISIYKFDITNTAFPSDPNNDPRISPSNLISNGNGNIIYRFVAEPNMNYLIIDVTSGARSNIPNIVAGQTQYQQTAKGYYVAGLYQAAALKAFAVNQPDIIIALEVVKNHLQDIKGSNFISTNDSNKALSTKIANLPDDVWDAL